MKFRFVDLKNAQKYNFELYMEYIFSKSCFALKLWENESHKYKQAMFQIQGWYLKKTFDSNMVVFDREEYVLLFSGPLNLLNNSWCFSYVFIYLAVISSFIQFWCKSKNLKD